jgi:hypothetical protein
MANEVEWTYASQVTLDASGASAASNVFVAADDTTLASGNHSNYPWADFVLKTVGHGAAVGSNGYIALYRQDLNMDGTAGDAAVPAAANPVLFVGAFRVPDAQASNATTYYSLTDVPLSADCAFYIENKTTQSLTAGWTLKVTPKTYAPGA